MCNPNKRPTRILLAGATLLAGFAALTVRADYSNTVASFNPVGYWRLSETVSPPAANIVTNLGSLGTAADGYVAPGYNIAQGVVGGPVGTSFTFTNTTAGANAVDPGANLEVPYLAAMNPNGPFSVEFWAKPGASPTPHTGDLLGFGSINTAQNRSGWLFYHDTGGNAGGDHRWEFRIGGTAGYCYVIDSANGSAPEGVWKHVVGVYDGTFARLYMDGLLVAGPTAITPGRNFNPNNAAPFRIGEVPNFGRNFDGGFDEVAFYNTALSADTVYAHKDCASTNNAGYRARILADNPLGYWPLDEPVYNPPAQSTLPVTANSGTLGALANGTNQPGLTAGVAGPQFAGFPGGNLGTKGGYLAGNVDLGNPDGLNFGGPITMMAWVKPQYSSGLRNILSHGYRSTPDQEVQLRINGGKYDVGSWSPGEGTNSAAGLATQDIGNWVFLAGTFDGTDWRLYRYGSLIAGPSPGLSGALVMDASWSIGSRGDTSTDGRFSGAWIDEVAIFTNALTAAQIQSIFVAAQMSPVIVVAPQTPAGTVYEGANLNFSVVAAGAPTLLYQWTKDSVPLGGQTSTSLALNNVVTNTSGIYAVVVTNDYGSITSSFPVTVLQAPPLITQQPTSATRYVGGTASFSVTAIGNPTLTYQWYFNTNTLIGGATASNYTKANVQLADAGKYNCRITNPYGSSNSAFATLTVLAAPTGYPAGALADNPVAYWRLGETTGTVANDYWGGHNGTYNGVTKGVSPGYSFLDPDTAAGFTAVNTYVGNITGIDFSGATSTFSLEAWVNGTLPQVAGTDANATIIGKGRGQNGQGGNGFWQYVLEVANGKYQFRVQDGVSATQTGTATADVGPDGTWQHVVGVYDQGGATVTIYVNGLPSGTIGTPPAAGPTATIIPTSIGAGQGGIGSAYDMYFKGSIDEVAIYNTALTAAQVAAHKCLQYGASQPPLFVSQPASFTNYEGLPGGFSAAAIGSCELTNQWKKEGVDIPGATLGQLQFPALSLSDSGNYRVLIGNSLGTTNSSTVYLAVLPAPTSPPAIAGLVLHLPFDGNLNDVTGRGNNGTGKVNGANVNPAATPAGNPAFNYTDAGAPGKIGKALHYSTSTSTGSSNYVTLGVRPDLKFSSNVNFSVAYWFRFSVPNEENGDLPFLCSANNSYGGAGYTFAPSYKLGGWSYSLNGVVQLYGPDHNVSDGNWHHLVHTFNRTGSAITYLDGLQADARSMTTAGNLDNANAVNIGQDPVGNYAEDGNYDIDDLGIWKKALTPLEAASIYIAGASNSVSFVSAPGTFVLESLPGGLIRLSWNVGVLQSAANVIGPYTDVPGATSPYTTSAASAQRFFKLRN